MVARFLPLLDDD